MVEGVRPGKSLSQIGLTGRAGFLPQHTCLWKAERESHALGTRSGNCLYMKVSNCSGIKRIRTWDANIAGIKGRRYGAKLIMTEKWKQDLEPCPGMGCRKMACSSCWATRFHPSLSQLTSGIWTEMEGGDSFRILWRMEVENLFRPLLVKIFLTHEIITRLKREIKARLYLSTRVTEKVKNAGLWFFMR